MYPMKYTRIVTAERKENGTFVFMCSCGFDFRFQGTCKHISMLLLHATKGQCAGCEIENIALRNTAAFAACRDAALIRRAAYDWKGVVCGHVTEESLNVCPYPCEEDDGSGDDGRDVGGDDGEGPMAGPSRAKTRQTSEEIQLKAKREARMKEIQDHYYRLKAKLESCKTADFWEKADGVDGHILEAYRELGGVADVAQTVVAHRYRGDPQRRKRPAPAAQPKRTALAAAGGGFSSRSDTSTRYTPSAAGEQRYAVIHISDSEELEDYVQELRNDGASSSD